MKEREEGMYISVEKCSFCGNNHPKLDLYKLGCLVEGKFTHYSICPETQAISFCTLHTLQGGKVYPAERTVEGKASIPDCSLCGQNHILDMYSYNKSIEFYRGGKIVLSFNFWVICPVTNNPIPFDHQNSKLSGISDYTWFAWEEWVKKTK